MIQPRELTLDLPVELANGVTSSTAKVWSILYASYKGDVKEVEKLATELPELIYAQYNYTPPIHFAVREGHVELVKYLLANHAYDASYRTYPFQDSLLVVAADRGHHEVVELLGKYRPTSGEYKGDNGRIQFSRSVQQKEFETAVDQNDLQNVAQILKRNPEFALDETYFWGEGILTMPAKENQREMIDLLMRYGAKVPKILKWAQAYYFEHNEGSVYMLEKGMSPDTMSWHHVTILHDMAQKGDLKKAELLLTFGAEINGIDEEFQSTPLGLAARWGNTEMVKYLLERGADPNKTGAPWATPLEWASKKGHSEIEEILRRAGAK